MFKFRPGPAGRAGVRRAYLVSVGVSGYENPDWNLHFAADDARLFAAQVGARLRATNEFEEVVEVVLTADAGEMVLVIDACHAGASLAPGGQRSRGR